VRVVRPWARLPRGAVAAPSLAGFKARLDGAGSTLGWWKGSLPRAGGGTRQNHRMLGIGRDLWGSPSPTPCPSRVTQSRGHSTASRRGWNISREGDSTASLGSLGQGSKTIYKVPSHPHHSVILWYAEGLEKRLGGLTEGLFRATSSAAGTGGTVFPRWLLHGDWLSSSLLVGGVE